MIYHIPQFKVVLIICAHWGILSHPYYGIIYHIPQFNVQLWTGDSHIPSAMSTLFDYRSLPATGELGTGTHICKHIAISHLWMLGTGENLVSWWQTWTSLHRKWSYDSIYHSWLCTSSCIYCIYLVKHYALNNSHIWAVLQSIEFKHCFQISNNY